MSRLKMSRPSLSVPRRWAVLPPSCQTGGVSRLESEPFSGSWGATHGASTAGMMSRNMRIESATIGYRRAPRRVSAIREGTYQGRDRTVTVAIEMPPSPVADSRVEVRVEDVDQEVRHDEDRREHDHDGLDDLVVTRPDGVDGQQPGARPGEDALGHDRSGHQDARDDREERQRGDRRVPEAVLPDHLPLGESLDPGQLHELRVEDVQHRGADQPHDGGHLEPAEVDGGKDHVLDPAAARGR